MSDFERFRQYLQGQIDKIGYSIRETARKAGVNHSYISKILSGDKKTIPSPEILKKLADVLPCSYYDLMDKAGHLNFIEEDEAPPKIKKLYDVIARAEELPEENIDQVADALEALIKHHIQKSKEEKSEK